jgi:hypothetical protein
MNKLTFHRVFSYWDKVDLVTIRTRTKDGAVFKFEPTIDPLADEIASWQKTFDDAAYFKVGDGTWLSREQFERTLDAEGI